MTLTACSQFIGLLGLHMALIHHVEVMYHFECMCCFCACVVGDIHNSAAFIMLAHIPVFTDLLFPWTNTMKWKIFRVFGTKKLDFWNQAK